MASPPGYRGMDILEVGSGRGGGLAFITKRHKPKFAIGIDFCRRQVDFCNKVYDDDRLCFMWGDAENITLGTNLVDRVISIESSHTYGNFANFLKGVDKVLRPSGYFVIADFLLRSDLQKYEDDLMSLGYQLKHKEDITENVTLAMKLDSTRRLMLIKSRAPKILHGLLKHFSGVEGSNIYNKFVSGECVYMFYCLSSLQAINNLKYMGNISYLTYV